MAGSVPDLGSHPTAQYLKDPVRRSRAAQPSLRLLLCRPVAPDRAAGVMPRFFNKNSAGAKTMLTARKEKFWTKGRPQNAAASMHSARPSRFENAWLWVACIYIDSILLVSAIWATFNTAVKHTKKWLGIAC